MTAAFLRWFTFGVVALAAMGLLVSVPFFIVVWSSNATNLFGGHIPARLGSDTIKAIVFLGFFISAMLSGFNAAFPRNSLNRRIWLTLIIFYFVSGLVCLFPANVNENLVAGIRTISLFFLFLVALCIANLLFVGIRFSAKA